MSNLTSVPADNWKRKEVWKREGSNFAVEVSRHECHVFHDDGCFDSEGPHRWCVYVYVYPKHPSFSEFKPEGDLYDQPSFGMHWGNSYFRVWRSDEGEIKSFQVGSDYNHFDDWRYTRMATKKEAYSVFADAGEIFDMMALREKSVAEKSA